MVGGAGGVALAVVVFLRFLNDCERGLVEVFVGTRELIFAKRYASSVKSGSVSIDDDRCFTEDGLLAGGLVTTRFFPSNAL